MYDFIPMRYNFRVFTLIVPDNKHRYSINQGFSWETVLMREASEGTEGCDGESGSMVVLFNYDFKAMPEVVGSTCAES